MVLTDTLAQSSTLSPSPAMALTTFSYFALMKGIGNVVTGPISSALISLSPAIHRDAYANGKFKGLVVFSGACMMASAAVMVVWYVGKVVAGRLRRKGQFCECPA